MTRELRVMLKLEHPNVLPLKGFIQSEQSALPSLVTEWMENGSLKQYLREHADANAFFLVGVLIQYEIGF